MLLVVEKGNFFMNRSRKVTEVQNVVCGNKAPFHSLPLNTVLDGELVTVAGV